MNPSTLGLHAGDVVQILTEAEIRATLDKNGLHEGLPFMPEMWRFCGKKYRVFHTAEKVCVEGTLLRHMKNAVFLGDLRCDGADHDGCKRACLIFWKEAWLKRSEGPVEPLSSPDQSFSTAPAPQKVDPEKTYSCQSTYLFAATEPLSRWTIQQYIRDVTSGNFGALHVIRALLIVLYNRISRMTGRREFGTVRGALSKTPAVALNLRPGEIVEVKNKEEIASTINVYAQNRGLTIDYEMLRHTGRHFRVMQRVDRIILETTGKMREIENTVLLEGNVCEGICRRACSRASYPMWREAWLKRVEGQTSK